MHCGMEWNGTDYTTVSCLYVTPSSPKPSQASFSSTYQPPYLSYLSYLRVEKQDQDQDQERSVIMLLNLHAYIHTYINPIYKKKEKTPIVRKDWKYGGGMERRYWGMV